MRHPPEDHLVEQTLGPGEDFLSRVALAPAVRQVGEVDNEAAFLSRDQIDGPCRRIGRSFRLPLLSQVADRQTESPISAKPSGMKFWQTI